MCLSACSVNHPLLDRATTEPATVMQNPHKITLLVPLSGENAKSGEAIRNGFLAAYYYAKQTLPNPPSINVVDTASQHITTAYQQAVNKGANFIVGPLTKPELQTLADQNHLTVPTLALNTLDRLNAVPHLYQFGLLPQDEAKQIAIKAKQAGFSKAVMIVPPGRWGTDIAKAFQQQWQASGGTTTGTWSYTTTNISNLVRNATATHPDVIFLAAFPNYARQIKPLINLYAGKNIPVYATSLVYTGIPSRQDHDLDGIVFNDMPWIIGPDTPAWHQIRDNIQTISSTYNQFPRLYAFGIDAYHLTYTFNQLSTGIEGTTGRLTLDDHNRIHRTLNWAKFENGNPEPLP